jgi:hypothetical protein
MFRYETSAFVFQLMRRIFLTNTKTSQSNNFSLSIVTFNGFFNYHVLSVSKSLLVNSPVCQKCATNSFVDDFHLVVDVDLEN